MEAPLAMGTLKMQSQDAVKRLALDPAFTF